MTTVASSAETGRCCLTCGQLLHISARTPNKRFCSPRCRARWHRRNPRRPSEPVTGRPETNGVAERRHTADAVTNGVPGTAAGTGRCPHCGQQVAIITMLVTPAAAHVPLPTPPPGQQP